MPWIRSGDNAATYPPLMSTAGMKGADERTVNEVAGFVFRCAFQSGAHMTDYRIDVGTAYMIGGARTDELVRLCVRAGLMTPVNEAGLRYWQLVADPEFIHIRLRREVEWERQQRNDTRNPAIRVGVLRRDGDQCRWCGKVVQWRGRTTNRSGTLDHLKPGEAGTVETMVVACKGCNSARQDNPGWDDERELLPVPQEPLYGRHTADYLTEHGYPVEPNLGPSDATQQPQARPSGADTAPTRVRPATTASDAGATSAGPEAGLDEKSHRNSLPGSDKTGSAGSGRVGTALGSSGSGPDGEGSQSGLAPPGGGRRRRGRRGRGSRMQGGSR